MQQPYVDTIEIPLIYIEVFVLMFVSFLIGYLFAFYYQKSKYKLRLLSQKQDIETKESYKDSDFAVVEDDPEEKNSTSKSNSKNFFNKKSTAKGDHYLDYERLGYANETIKDDLQRIVGIGPYTEEKLNDIGIYTYAQISRLKDHDIKIVTQLIRFFPDRIKNDKWTEQAKMFISEKKPEGKNTLLKA